MKNSLRLGANVLGLGSIQGLNLLVTLVTLPYLTRVFGVVVWGNIVFVLLVVNYLISFINWGFYLGAAQRISANREDKTKIGQLISNVFMAQVLLTFFSILVLFSIAYFLPKTQTQSLYVYAVLILIGNLLNPVWIFHGLERVWEATFVLFLAKLFTLPLIFWLIDDPKDAGLYLLLNGAMSAFVGVLSLIWITQQEFFQWHQTSFKQAGRAILEDSRIFITSMISSLNDSIIPLSIGVLGGSTELGLFNIADRVKSASITLFNPILHAINPRIAYLFSSSKIGISQILKYSFLITFFISALLGIAIFYYAPQLIHFLGGDGFDGSVYILQLISPVPMLSALSALMVYSVLVPMGHKNYYFLSSIIGLFFTMIIIYPCIQVFPDGGAAIALLGSEFLRFAILFSLMWCLRTAIVSKEKIV